MTVIDAFDDFEPSNTLLVTVQTDDQFQEEGRDAVERLADGESVETSDVFSFPSVGALFETFTAQTVELLETIATEHPESIRATARLVDRDVKNVHEELTELERLGLLELDRDGRAKRPSFPYEEVVIDLPLGDDAVADAESRPSEDVHG